MTWFRGRIPAGLPAALVVIAMAGCSVSSTSSPTSPATSATSSDTPTAAASATAPAAGTLVIVGRIVTMAEPPVAEALLIDDGTVVAVGTRNEVLALAGDDVPVITSARTPPIPDSSTPTPTGWATATTTVSIRRPRPCKPR